MIKLTEQESNHQDLDKMSIAELLQHMNEEDQTVPKAVQKSMPQIQRLVEVISDRMLAGGRLFYIGAGTSGRLGIVDASECPPTFGVPHGLVIGLIAGGDAAIRKAVEFAEDDRNQGWNDLLAYSITEKDVVVGIAASGTTPYVIGALNKCREQGIATGCITCNIDSPVAAACEYPIEVPVGPEFVTGSTRLKSGTAQKLVLNMISTSVMIQLGRVEGNRMVNMQLSNEKLVDRGVKMLMDKTHQSYEDAKECLIRVGSVKKAFDAWLLQNK
jgi:N-acetylmuramic acid 6-phosphate etherase